MNPVSHVRVHPALLLLSRRGWERRERLQSTAREGAGSWGQTDTQPRTGTHGPGRDVPGRSRDREQPLPLAPLGSWRQIFLFLRLLQAWPWALQSSPLLSVPSRPVPAGFEISTLVCRHWDLDFAGSCPREQPHPSPGSLGSLGWGMPESHRHLWMEGKLPPRDALVPARPALALQDNAACREFCPWLLRKHLVPRGSHPVLPPLRLSRGQPGIS